MAVKIGHGGHLNSITFFFFLPNDQTRKIRKILRTKNQGSKSAIRSLEIANHATEKWRIPPVIDVLISLD
jgi:hypothetical protein